MKKLLVTLSFVCLLITLTQPEANAAPEEDMAKSLVVHAPFDDSFDARVGRDKAIYTAESLDRKNISAGNKISKVTLVADAGRHGGALRFAEKTTPVLFFKGLNSGYQAKDWSGTVSFWMKLDPDKDLPEGYCDPIQITEKAWNDAAFFVDFDKDLPRAFRLGVFADYKVWNPKDTAWEKIAVADRPMVPVAKPPFASDKWTHIAWTFKGVNSSDGSDAIATLYLDGKAQGSMMEPSKFSWDIDKVAIMIGIYYIGDYDDLAIFNRAFTDAEVKSLYELPQGVSSLQVP